MVRGRRSLSSARTRSSQRVFVFWPASLHWWSGLQITNFTSSHQNGYSKYKINGLAFPSGSAVRLSMDAQTTLPGSQLLSACRGAPRRRTEPRTSWGCPRGTHRSSTSRWSSTAPRFVFWSIPMVRLSMYIGYTVYLTGRYLGQRFFESSREAAVKCGTIISLNILQNLLLK